MDTSTEHRNTTLLPDGFNGEMVGPPSIEPAVEACCTACKMLSDKMVELCTQFKQFQSLPPLPPRISPVLMKCMHPPKPAVFTDNSSSLPIGGDAV